MFKFNFSEDNTNDNSTINDNKIIWLEAKEIVPSKIEIPDGIDNSIMYYFKCKNGRSIKHLPKEHILTQISEADPQNSIIYAECNHSDLITGVYEGGLKIWECTKDLIDFLCTEQINLKEKHVLDLGCGVGTAGIFALLNESHVYFQDYNAEVITSTTIPNVALNVENIGNLSTSKFYSGDWKSFSNIMKNNNTKFDYIFTSETIYNIDNYDKLHSVFVNCLRETGVIYLAAKTHYFGVGGGLRSFEDFIRKKGYLNYKTRWMCPDGISREILEMTRKEKS